MMRGKFLSISASLNLRLWGLALVVRLERYDTFTVLVGPFIVKMEFA